MRSVTSLFFIVVVLGGCASMGKGSSRVATLNGVDLEEKRGEALKKKGEFVWGEWPEERWWEVFHDEGLSKIINTALQENPSLQSVEARVRQVQGQAEVVRSRLLPQIGAIFNMMWAYFGKGVQRLTPQLDPNFHLYTAALDFQYEFDFWGKNRGLLEAALGGVMVEESLYKQARVVLSASIALEYFHLQATAAKMQRMEELLINRVHQMELVLLRDQHRIDSGIDKSRIQEEVVSLQGALAVVKEELALGKSMLLTLMGHNPAGPLDVPIFWRAEYAPFELPENMGLDLLAKRGDIAAEIARVKKSAKLVGVAISEFFPNINLAAFVGFYNLDFEKLFRGESFTPSLLPLIQLPIFQGGRLRANLREKIAAHEAAVYEYNSLVLKASNEVVSGINRLMSLNERLQFYQEEMRFAQQIYQYTDITYKQGIVSLLTLLQAKEKYLWVELHQIELEWIKYESIIQLIKALGGGFHS